MLKIKIDGVVKTIQYNKSGAGWTYYNVVDKGLLVSEFSIPSYVDVKEGKFKFVTGGCLYENI